MSQIYSGEWGTAENIKETEEFREITSEVNSFISELEKTLTEERKFRLKNIIAKIDEEAFEYAENHFTEGFKKGILLGIEISG